MSNKIVVEIGANNGKDTQRLLNEYSDAVIYAFEPTHELLVNYLWPLAKLNERLKILPFAVDNENTFKTFNIAGQADWGCSSLYQFADDLDTKWPGRPDFKSTHSYSVPTITMYDICNLYNITEIEYIHIDTQGSDLNCLLSFKDKINIIKSGRCEVAANTELYKNTNNTYSNVRNWLLQNGFNVNCNEDVPTWAHEIDIMFDRP